MRGRGVVGRLDQEGLIKPEAFVILKEGVTGSPALAAELDKLSRTALPLPESPAVDQLRH